MTAGFVKAIPLFAMLAACETTPPSAAPTRVQTLHLICAKTIALDINFDSETAVVKSGSGQLVMLKRDHSSAAPRFAGSGYALMLQDGIYILTAPDGAARDCEPLGE
ncbi:hypothetical protein G7076_02585 [Sphingomonas sp. HDW15A]|uniref:hypothetical protein n=1 Tax=Sphingomonas sp. HDW15A TaxID=2714942 RepID=UPI00140C1610|nr:hypothetical protein [Sphingomonas sp. HDW15A]QIK95514.1 hypothetical protein G7076_02585 [Sphingomonas sp. HDW15A]